PAAGGDVTLHVFPPEGVPYVGETLRVTFPKGTARRQVEIALPRGVMLHGKVAEKMSGQAIDQAQVYFLPQRVNNPHWRGGLLVGPDYPVYSQPDGSFRLVVPLGPGHLLCHAPGHDFIAQAMSAGELKSGKPGGDLTYYHGVRALNYKGPSDPREVTLTPCRGVTIRGRVVGPDGQAVPWAVLCCGGDLLTTQSHVLQPYHPSAGDLGQVLAAEQGRFELRGCDPDRTYRLFLLPNPP